MIRTNAVIGRPTASWSITARYPAITPASSRIRTAEQVGRVAAALTSRLPA
ncbi:hypothetical protein AB0F72_38185 [Actinoplanes sp. NPDC023936]|uniref:hypothetical protein n=1 Tax=Actinoplanes sp. NPDC023936 TaxID=3154910 RepID=UPI0033FC2E96